MIGCVLCCSSAERTSATSSSLLVGREGEADGGLALVLAGGKAGDTSVGDGECGGEESVTGDDADDGGGGSGDDVGIGAVVGGVAEGRGLVECDTRGGGLGGGGGGKDQPACSNTHDIHAL